MECAKKKRIDNVPSLHNQWSSYDEVDWNIIKNNYALAIDSLLRQFISVQGDDLAYGLIFQLAQNWHIEIHINTLEGIKEIPNKLKNSSEWHQGLSDEELISKVGIWDANLWKYADISCIFNNDLATGIDQYNYDLFERLYELDGSQELEDSVNKARLSAIESARNSSSFRAIAKTEDFAHHVADDDGLDYYTKARFGD